jgi:hypothetical protein
MALKAGSRKLPFKAGPVFEAGQKGWSWDGEDRNISQHWINPPVFIRFPDFWRFEWLNFNKFQWLIRQKWPGGLSDARGGPLSVRDYGMTRMTVVRCGWKRAQLLNSVHIGVPCMRNSTTATKLGIQRFCCSNCLTASIRQMSTDRKSHTETQVGGVPKRAGWRGINVCNILSLSWFSELQKKWT